MTLMTPEQDVRAAEEMIRRVHDAYAELFEALKELIARARRGETGTAKDVSSLTREIARAMNTLNDAEAKLDAIRRKDAGIVHDFAIDFDWARSEIRGRLNSIEAAG